MRVRACLHLLLVALALSACTIRGKRAVIARVIDDEGTRRESFEATLRILDERPEYVREFFQLALEKHPPTLEKFISLTTEELHREQLAALTGKYLARNPDSLYQVLIATLEAAEGQEAAEDAVARAIADRSQLSARVLGSSAPALRTISMEVMELASNRQEAREAFLQAVNAKRGIMASMLATEPRVLEALVAELLEFAVKRPQLAQVLVRRTVAVLDQGPFARVTAEQLVQHPEVMQAVLISSLEAAREAPQAQQAIALSIERRADLATAYIARRPETVVATMLAMLDAVEDQPQARQALVGAVRERRAQLARLLASHPQTMVLLLGEFAELGIQGSVIANKLRFLLEEEPAVPSDERLPGGGR